LASRRHGTLYTGVTSELIERVSQHRAGEIEGFTKRDGVKRLVWFERHDSIVEAIQRETSIKRWRREWKINLIELGSPTGTTCSPASWSSRGRSPTCSRAKGRCDRSTPHF
jgi:putative endonuclease